MKTKQRINFCCGDYDDPIRSGILRKSCMRTYRERIQAERKTNVFHGLLIAMSLTAILSLYLMYQSNLCKSEQPSPVEDPTQLDFWKFLQAVGMFIFDATQHITARDFYCSQKIDISSTFKYMRQEILNQEQALNNLERIMRKRSRFSAVALVGSPGVGKTMTAMILRQKFPWPENVHYYSWSTYVPDEVRKFHLVRNFIDQLSNCGQNLLIIDNLTTCDYSFVPIFNSLIKDREGDNAAAANQNVMVVYIFSMETEHYWNQFELLQQLPSDTTIISYRPFGQEELADCLHNELKNEKRYLSQDVFGNILNDIDVYETGCKTIHKAVITHGIIQN